MSDVINRPAHYAFSAVEPIDVIERWGLGFCLGNAVKYIARAGRKDPTKIAQDLLKARWYIIRSILNYEMAVSDGPPLVHDVVSAWELSPNLAAVIEKIYAGEKRASLEFLELEIARLESHP